MSGRAATVADYVRFSQEFARGVSDIYADLAEGVAQSDLVLDFLDTLPTPKRQPNLLLAALKYRFGVPETVAHLEALVADHAVDLRHIMLTRATQTNEPARCAALLPLLAQLPGPLAVLEVGASAGLCLLPDLYGYDYGTLRIGAKRPCFPCVVNDRTPLPAQLPDIVWRRGLDLDPVDVTNDDDIAWLAALIWPGQGARETRFREAVKIARQVPPEVVQGDLLEDLATVARNAPTDGRLVIYHTTVLMYVPDARDRMRFAEQVRDLGAVWIMNEDPELFPDIAVSAPPPPGPGRLLLSMNGQPVAWTQPHGQSICWFEDRPIDPETWS